MSPPPPHSTVFSRTHQRYPTLETSVNLLWDRASLIFEEQFGVRRREERERKEGGGERTVFAVCGVRCAVCGGCTVYCVLYICRRERGRGGRYNCSTCGARCTVCTLCCVHCAVYSSAVMYCVVLLTNIGRFPHSSSSQVRVRASRVVVARNLTHACAENKNHADSNDVRDGTRCEVVNVCVHARACVCALCACICA